MDTFLINDFNLRINKNKTKVMIRNRRENNNNIINNTGYWKLKNSAVYVVKLLKMELVKKQ